MKRLLIAGAAFLLCQSVLPSKSLAQSLSVFWLTDSVVDVSSGRPNIWVDTLRFGNAPAATSCLDSISPSLVERSCPTDIFESWRMPISSACRNQDFCYLDLRGLPSNPAQKDTFFIRFGEGPFNMKILSLTFRWPDAAYLGARCDSMRLHGIGGASGIDLNMFDTDSLVIDLSDSAANTYQAGLYIYKYGVKLVDAARETPRSLPSRISLSPSYPNPANPAASISYAIPSRSFVRLDVYDVLGRLVSTLVDEEKPAGSYSVRWDATAKPSGVYYYRLSAGGLSRTQKLVVVR